MSYTDNTAGSNKPRIGAEADKILQEARDFYAYSLEQDSWNRNAALDDLKFVENIDNYQWPADAQKVRKGRPMLTENRCPQFTRRVVNNIRRNRPAISVIPASSDATVQIANVLEGMSRHVEQRSRADLSYDGASSSAVKASIGYWRVATEYADDKSFDQELCIKPIRNAFTVYDDPDCVMPDRSDRTKCIVSERIPRKGFKEKYGVEPADFQGNAGTGDDILEWVGQDEVRIAEYWRVITEKIKVYQDPMSGRAMTEADTPEPMRKVLRSREAEKCKVEMHLLTADKIIESTDWPGIYIPIVAVLGEEEDIEGQKFRKSLIRDAKDAQRSINYFASAEVEITSLTPKIPWVGKKGAFTTDATKWGSMNTENWPYVEYDGNEAPNRTFPEFFSQGVREAKLSAIESMKAIMGLYDASLGARSNETSGVAIENRAKEGDNATYHFVDNYIRAIRFGGLIVVDLLPKIYDAARVVRILKPDGESEQAAINQMFVGPNGNLDQMDIGQGTYDVQVTAGSYQTQREESRESMIQLAKVMPQITQVAPDLIVGQFDFAEVDDLKQRLKATVPPNILGQGQQMPVEVQQAMQQIQQQQQQMQQAGAQLQADQQKVEGEKAKLEAEKTSVDAAKQILLAKYGELSAKLELEATKLGLMVPPMMPPGQMEPAIAPQQQPVPMPQQPAPGPMQ